MICLSGHPIFIDRICMRTLLLFLFLLFSASYLVSNTQRTYVSERLYEQYCNAGFGYCLIYPEEFEPLVTSTEEERDGITFICDDQLEFSVLGYYNVMNLSFAEMYSATQQELLNNYDRVEELSSVVYGVNFYEMEVRVGSRKMYEKTFDFNGKIVTLRVTAPADYSDKLWNLFKVKTTISLNV